MCRCKSQQEQQEPSADCNCNERVEPHPLTSRLFRGLISRRKVFTTFVGAASGFSTWKLMGSPKTAGAASLDPQWDSLIKAEQINNTNQAVVFRPNKGLAVSFGDNIYLSDLATKTFSFCTGQQQILSGRTLSTVRIGSRTQFQSGNGIIRNYRVMSADEREVAFTTRFEYIDPTRCNTQLDLLVGLPGANPTFTYSSLYNACERLIHQERLSGVMPPFVATPMRLVARVLARENAPRALLSDFATVVNISSPPVTGGVDGGDSRGLVQSASDSNTLCEEAGAAIERAIRAARNAELGGEIGALWAPLADLAAVNAAEAVFDCLVSLISIFF